MRNETHEAGKKPSKSESTLVQAVVRIVNEVARDPEGQMPQEQFQRVKQEQKTSPESSEEDRDSTDHNLHRKRCDPKSDRMMMEKTFEEQGTLNQVVVMIANGTARAWSFPPRSRRQRRCRRKPST